MTASKTQPRKGHQRRIIERPRLMKMLDDADARTILLLAPAGYGKTTLARQWAKTLNGVVFLTLSSAHRDVSVLATDLGARIAEQGRGNRADYIQSYVRARANPQRAARSIALVVADEIRSARLQWLILDDYHELVSDPAAEEFIETIHTETDCRVLVATRQRPSWAQARLAIYGDILEIGREMLAMNLEESTDVLGRRRHATRLVEQAGGWPAVIGLAATTGWKQSGTSQLPSALHDYMTDELYRSAPEDLRKDLVRIALSVDLEDETLKELFGDERHSVVSRAADLGFLSANDGVLELHPLFREYLFQQLAKDNDVTTIVESAIERAAERDRWERAFQLILRFNRPDLAASVLERAYVSLLRSGRLGTIGSFIRGLRLTPAFPPPVVELAEAELALRDGSFQLATRIATRVRDQLPSGHGLQSRTHALLGTSAFIRGELSESEASYRCAVETAATPDDEAEALRGWALTSVQGELPSAELAVSRLERRKHESPSDLVRFATAQLARRRFSTGMPVRPPEIDEAVQVADRVRDPSARSALFYSIAYVLAVRADYRESRAMIDRADADIDAFDLDFARPYSDWNLGLIAMGERRFGEAERIVQSLEDFVAERPLPYHALNTQILRARLLMQTNRLDEAVAHLPTIEQPRVIPSIYGEYFATRALARGATGDRDGCLADAKRSLTLTSAVEVRALACAARVSVGHASAREFWDMCAQLGSWDPLLAAARASRAVADGLAAHEEIRPRLATLYGRANDVGLSRRAGLRTRSTRRPDELLSPRELEVLGLLAQGLRNKDISKALVISDATTKVHIRHIFEKLGIRTRAQAVARYEMLRQTAAPRAALAPNE